MPELQKEKPKPKEIERKFLIASLPPDLDKFPKKEISQGYLAITPDGTEVRLREKGNKYYQTIKTAGGKIRGETEIEITKEQFQSLWPMTEGKRVEKTRYEIPYQNSLIELDVYAGSLKGLLTAEVEFKTEKGSNEFTPPDWFGKEVTEDKRYKNQNLAIAGKPEISLKQAERKKEISTKPEYELQEGLGILVDKIKSKAEKSKEPIIVQIAGGSASGKTSEVSDKVKKVFGHDSITLSMDDYYRGKTFMESEAQKGNNLNWDQPEALNLELLQKHLKQLKNGQEIEKPVYDMKISEPARTENVKPAKIIIIEGLFALNDKIEKQGDVKAFVDIGTHGRILRRLLRDIERTGQKPADILKYFSEVVEPMHEKYINSTKKNADIIIKNEYQPEVEADRSGLHEIQLKFKGEIANEILRKLGAERLGEVMQTDNYYNPQDRDLISTGEILRIREEGNKRILTYKGPKMESDFRKRPKFEFEIDNEIEKKFLSIYGDKIKTIKKERTLFELDGIIFSLDKVKKIEAGKESNLGTFIEIRSTGKETDEEKIKKVIEKLGLNFKQGFKESYFEM